MCSEEPVETRFVPPRTLLLRLVSSPEKTLLLSSWMSSRSHVQKTLSPPTLEDRPCEVELCCPTDQREAVRLPSMPIALGIGNVSGSTSRGSRGDEAGLRKAGIGTAGTCIALPSLPGGGGTTPQLFGADQPGSCCSLAIFAAAAAAAEAEESPSSPARLALRGVCKPRPSVEGV